MTDDTNHSPPASPAGMMRGLGALLAAMIIVPIITLSTVQSDLITPGYVIGTTAVILAYLAALGFSLRRWLHRRTEWRAAMIIWLTSRNIPTGIAAQLIDAQGPAAPEIEQFAGASFVNRVEGPLGDIYLVIREGEPALYDVVGDRVEPMSARSWPEINYDDVAVVTAATNIIR